MFDIRAVIDFSKYKVGYDSDGEEYFLMDIGSGKYYPCGNSCTYKGKTVPCLVEFSEGGGISGNILMNVLSKLDDLKLYDNDRKNVIIPALLVDGHGICFELGFLNYICD